MFLSTQRSHLDDGRSGCCVECSGVDTSQMDDPAVAYAALANGVEVGAGAWTVVEDIASAFVLSEAIIDAADRPTARRQSTGVGQLLSPR